MRGWQWGGFGRRLVWFGLLYALGLGLFGIVAFGLHRAMDALVGPAHGATAMSPAVQTGGGGQARPGGTGTVAAGRAGFDIVRIAPDGAAVIAGHAPPGATVAVTADGRPLGTAAADQSGSWVLLPAQRLRQGPEPLALAVRIVAGAGSPAPSPQPGGAR